MNEPIRVLIIGGYGQAGQRLAALMAEKQDCVVTLAGRSEDKARAAASRISRRTGGRVMGVRLDLGEPDHIRGCATNQSIVMVACELSAGALAHLIEACLREGSDYVDIVPQSSKAAVFARYRDAIEASTSRFVLDAGADPGLPNWLTRYVVRQATDPMSVTLWGRYRSTGIGWDGAGDILRGASSQGWLYDDGWRRAPWWDMTYPNFGGGLGRSLAVPIVLDELQALPGDLGLRHFQFYHAGLNPVTDLMMLLEGAALRRFWSFQTRQRLFFRAMKRFTRPGFGLALAAEAGSNQVDVRCELWHPDLYEATAVPPVSIAVALTQNPDLKAGFDYLGYWADRVGGFRDALEQDGFRIHLSRPHTGHEAD